MSSGAPCCSHHLLLVTSSAQFIHVNVLTFHFFDCRLQWAKLDGLTSADWLKFHPANGCRRERHAMSPCYLSVGCPWSTNFHLFFTAQILKKKKKTTILRRRFTRLFSCFRSHSRNLLISCGGGSRRPFVLHLNEERKKSRRPPSGFDLLS